MSELAHRPRRRFGQNFLHDPGVIARIIAAIAPQRDEVIVEIGPGLGALTAPLTARLAHLHVIEIDRDLVAQLRERYSPECMSIHAEDALRVDFGQFPAPLRVVGNLPYNISTPLLFHLAHFAERIADAHFMLQREVVDRMVAEPNQAAYGRLSVALQARFVMEKLFGVASGAFRPAPKVESAIVRMIPRRPAHLDSALEAVFDQIVTRAFGQRRKTLRNALSGLVAATQLEQLGVDPGARGETLDYQTYLRIARILLPV